MLTNLDKAPFPYFGGKSKAAPLVWALLGDVDHYVEPFYGTGAVLLNRPHPANRPYYSETVNDLDGFVCNFWRAVQWYPVETAQAAAWPVCETDKSARQLALLRWRDAGASERLAGDAAWCDPVMAGWWAWAVSVQIGAFDGRQAWTADPVTGCIYKQPQTAREPGVRRARPQLGNNGRGVNHAGAREPGVSRDRPHLGNDGCGVNRPQAKEIGVLDPVTPAHGVSALDTWDWGAEYHNLTMPEMVRWFRHLAARLRHVRIVNGDWKRVCTSGVMFTITARMDGGHAGIFLDPPYSDAANRHNDLYAVDSLSVAHAVREWCVKWGTDPRCRIVLAGFDTEHTELEQHGWTVHEWFTDGYLTGGMGNTSQNNGDDEGEGTGGKTHQQQRERLWASPHCLSLEPDAPTYRQTSIFGFDDTDDT